MKTKRRKLSARRLAAWIAVLACVFALIGRPELCWHKNLKGLWLWSHGSDSSRASGVIVFAAYWVRQGRATGHREVIIWHDTRAHTIVFGAGDYGNRWDCMAFYRVSGP